MLYDFPGETDMFIRVFIHELFHALGIGCHNSWVYSAKYQKDREVYLDLRRKFKHTKKYLKADFIQLSKDGGHFKEGDLMTPTISNENRITLKSLYILKDLGHHINMVKTSDQFFEIKSII